MSRRSVVLVIIVLCFSVSSFVWGETCKQVFANLGEPGPILFDPDCNGWENCRSTDVMGTLNGVITDYSNISELIWLDDTVVGLNEAVIETSHGKIYLDVRAIIYWGAPDGGAANANVTGGTGRYEGATGWLAYVTWAGSEDRACWLSCEDGGGLIRGEICLPDE